MPALKNNTQVDHNRNKFCAVSAMLQHKPYLSGFEVDSENSFVWVEGSWRQQQTKISRQQLAEKLFFHL